MKLKLGLFILVIVMCSLEVDAQCAMCRAVLETEEGGQAAKGINNGILYLMIFPYLLIGGIAYFISRGRRKEKIIE